MAPTAAQVVIGTISVVVALVIAAYAVHAVLRGHRLWAVCAAGCLLVVAGVVGQRTFPSADAISQLGRDEAGRRLPGAWDAGVGIPVVGLHVTPVTLVGLLLAVAGTSLVLFFEAPASEPAATGPTLPRLEDDDAV
ncbi:MAG TPA: hypothetical protein VF112_07710 [Candidatus Dormibacteraeota bacterium]